MKYIIKIVVGTGVKYKTANGFWCIYLKKYNSTAHFLPGRMIPSYWKEKTIGQPTTTI